MLLEAIGLELVIDVADVDESLFHDETPSGAALRLAHKKLDVVAARHPDALCLCADTLVFVDETILAKPADAGDAQRMLGLLRGREHGVVTGVAVARGPARREVAVTTRVWFRDFDDGEAAAYVATGEPLDKAGAYGIQGGGGALTARIEGSYSNVVGLPVDESLALLRALS